jgi:hypothetical protein
MGQGKKSWLRVNQQCLHVVSASKKVMVDSADAVKWSTKDAPHCMLDTVVLLGYVDSE